MAGFTCTITEADGTARTSSHRGMSGARRVAATLMIERAQHVLADEAAWAPRTLKKLRQECTDALNEATLLMSWDGPTDVVLPDGVTIVIAAVPDDTNPPAAQRRSQKRAVTRGEARWLASAQFANDCACGCGQRVEQGDRTYYVPGTGVYKADHAPANAKAAA